ncbi:hypothetical protein BC828DRAFT_243661 [Blastocladiella britannica]|nr:hypothetical protein BC828DRAFT_243661 [Blastocladiella britannica]
MEAGTPAMLLAAASPMTLAAAAGLESELDLSAMQVEQARAVAAGPEGVRGLITPLGGYLPSGMASTPSAPGGPLDFSRRLTTSSLGGWSPSAGEATLTGFEPQRLPSDLYVPPGEEEGLPMFDLGLGLDLPFPEPPEPMPEPAPEMPWTGGPEERIHGPPTAMGAEPEMGAVSYEPTAAELGLQELEHEPPRKRARPAAARTSISRARAAEAASILILPAALYTDPDVVTASLVTPTHLGVPAARHAEFQAARMEWLARPAPAIEDMDSRIARRFVVRPQSTLLRVPQFEAPSPIRPGFAPVASDSSLLTAGMPYDRDIEEARAYYGEREAGEPLHFAEPGEPMPFTGMGPGAEEEPRARFPWELSRPVSETGLYELERDLQRAQLDTQRGVSMSPLPLPEIPPLDLSLGGQFREISEPPSELAVEAEIPTVETEDDHFQVYLESVMADREEEQVTLSTLVAQAGGTRSAAAQAFYHVLSLASRKRLKVAQDVPYGEIHVRL